MLTLRPYQQVHVHDLIAAELKRGVKFPPLLAWVRAEPDAWRREGWQVSANGKGVEQIPTKPRK